MSGYVQTSANWQSGSTPPAVRIQADAHGVRITHTEFNFVPSAFHLTRDRKDTSIYYVPLTPELADLLNRHRRASGPRLARLLEAAFPIPSDRVFRGGYASLTYVDSQQFGGGAGRGTALNYRVRSGTGTLATFSSVRNRPGGAFQGFDLISFTEGESGTLTLNGGAGLIKSGSGTLTLGSGTFNTGGTIINGGTLTLNGSGNLTLNGSSGLNSFYNTSSGAPGVITSTSVNSVTVVPPILLFGSVSAVFSISILPPLPPPPLIWVVAP